MMSIHDETWDRPICDYCHQSIPYGDRLNHYDGKCITILSIIKKSKNIMNKTKSTTTQFKVTCDKSADDIISLLTEYGFITDYPVDSDKLKKDISDIIVKNKLTV